MWKGEDAGEPNGLPESLRPMAWGQTQRKETGAQAGSGVGRGSSKVFHISRGNLSLQKYLIVLELCNNVY